MNKVISISPSTAVAEAAILMEKKNIGSMVIKERGNFLGILTERDILNKIVAAGKDPNKVTVNNIMSSPIYTIDADSRVSEASQKWKNTTLEDYLLKKTMKLLV